MFLYVLLDRFNICNTQNSGTSQKATVMSSSYPEALGEKEWYILLLYFTKGKEKEHSSIYLGRVYNREQSIVELVGLAFVKATKAQGAS